MAKYLTEDDFFFFAKLWLKVGIMIIIFKGQFVKGVEIAASLSGPFMAFARRYSFAQFLVYGTFVSQLHVCDMVISHCNFLLLQSWKKLNVQTKFKSILFSKKTLTFLFCTKILWNQLYTKDLWTSDFTKFL